MHIKLKEAIWSQNAATALQTTLDVLCHYFKGYFWNCNEISILLSGRQFCSMNVKFLPSFASMCVLCTNQCNFFYVTGINSLSMYLCDKHILFLSSVITV